MSDLPPPQPLTHARILRMALPIVLSSATVPLVGIVDTAVVGQTGEAEPIAAVGLAAVILSTLYWFFGFLRMGTTGLAGQAAGAGDTTEVSAILSRGLLIGLAAGLALIALQGVLFPKALQMTSAEPGVESAAQVYLTIRVYSAPAAIAVFAITGWLIAMERTGHVLVLQLVMNGVNIALDIWFVLGLGWGVAGVAWATFIAEWAALGLGLWLCRDAFANPAWRTPDRVFDKVKLHRMVSVNLNILLRSAALMGIFTSFMFLSPRFGTETLAANQVLMQFVTLQAYMLDGFAYTAEALVARAIGRRDRGRLRRAAWLCTLWGGISAIGMTALFWAAGGVFVDLMTTAPDVRELARDYLVWIIIAPLLAVWAFLLDGIFIGATRGTDLRNMMILSLIAYIAAVWALMPSWGNHGLWAALTLSYIARAVTLGARFPALERDIA